jgi:hypothetical protein
MATLHNFITLSDTEATLVSDPSKTGSGRDITLQNVNSSGYIYIGSSTVTSENYGYRIAANTAISFELPSQDEIFAVAQNDEMNLAVISITLENEN